MTDIEFRDLNLSADDHLIEQARRTAKAQHKTLNEAFREWLASYTRHEEDDKAIETLYRKLEYVNSGGRKYTREEMNER